MSGRRCSAAALTVSGNSINTTSSLRPAGDGPGLVQGRAPESRTCEPVQAVKCYLLLVKLQAPLKLPGHLWPPSLQCDGLGVGVCCVYRGHIYLFVVAYATLRNVLPAMRSDTCMPPRAMGRVRRA